MLRSPTCLISLSVSVVYWSLLGYAVAGTASNGPYGQPNTTASSASPTSQNPDGSYDYAAKVCLAGHCSGDTAATKTVDDDYGATLEMLPDSDLQAACVLWNSSCSGDKTSARNFFFGTLVQELDADACFTKPYDECTKIESPARLSEFQAIQSWMRSPQCFSGNAGYNSMVGMEAPVQDTENCCGTCEVTAGTVDVFYWPAPNASTSCLDIIGSNVNPLTYGATIDSKDGYDYFSDNNGVLTSTLPTYWGCTTRTGVELSFMSTAVVTHIGSVTFKQSMVNPWSAPSCVGSSLASPRSNGALAPRASIQARAHALHIRNVTAQAGGIPASVLISDGYTFTSPSIYANFQTISGADECGSQIITSTMLSFAPGGLSTIEGGLACPTCLNQVTKPLNVQDLPCPPQSVMEANWYKPEPGEPYHPLIAMPDQIKQINPFFSRCTDAFFTGFDPFRTLVPAFAMVPTTTADDPNAATSMAPMPSAIQDPGARQTANGGETKPETGATPAAQDPKATVNPTSDPKHDGPALLPQSEDPTSLKASPALPLTSPDGSIAKAEQASSVNANFGQAMIPTTTFDDPKQDSGASGDPSSPDLPAKPSSAPQITDPSNLSPYQMSQIKNALNPGSQGPQATPKSVQENESGSNQHALPSEAVFRSAVNPQTETTQTMPNSGSPQQDPAVPSVGNPNPSPPATTISVSNHVIVADPSGILFDGSQVASDQAHVVVSSVLAMNTGAGIALSNFIANPPSVTQLANIGVQPAQQYHPTILNGESAQRVFNGVSIAGATLTPGASPFTISGTPISVGPSNIIIGSDTVPLTAAFPAQTAPNAALYQATTINGEEAQLLSNGVSIAGTTLTPGASAVTISGTPISLGSSGLIIGTSSPIPLASAFPAQIAPNAALYQPTNINGEKAQLLSNGVSIAGTTLTPGASAVTISGTPISVGSSGLILGTSSPIPLASAFPEQIVTTLAGEAITLLPTAAEIAGAVLTLGSPSLTISGISVHVGSAGLVVGTITVPLVSDPQEQFITTMAGQAITAVPTAVEVAGTMLTPGAEGVTLNGTVVSLDTAGDLVLGTQTIGLASESVGLGGLIMAPFATTAPSSPSLGSPSAGAGKGTGTGGKPFVGRAESLQAPSLLSSASTLMAIMFTLMYIR